MIKKQKQKKERFILYINSEIRHKLKVIVSSIPSSMSEIVQDLVSSYLKSIKNNQETLDYKISRETINKIKSEVVI